MKSEKESLIESRDFRQKDAIGEKKQFMASLAIAAGGATMAGIGIGYMMNGEIAGGAMGLTVGTVMAASAGNLAMGEIQAYADLTAETAVRQHQIDQLPE